jgi:group I intron endonuclease
MECVQRLCEIEKRKKKRINRKMGEIYMAVNTTNSKKYVGQAVCWFSNGRKWGSIKRWRNHVERSLRGICECRALENAIRKYGDESFTLLILEECPVEELNYWEDYYIREYDTIAPNGYNLMSGGGNGRIHHQETRAKMSETRTGKKHSETTKQRMSLAQMGKVVSVQTRQSIGQTSKYRNMSVQNKEKIQKALDELGIERLPMYIGYTLDRRYGRNVDVITVRVTPPKKFADKKRSLVEKIQLAIEYLQFHTQRSSV